MTICEKAQSRRASSVLPNDVTCCRIVKKLFLILLSIALLAGCARRYKITLSNNHVMTATSKPKLNKAGDSYEFKDKDGKPRSLPAGSVKQIEPQARGHTEEPILKPSR